MEEGKQEKGRKRREGGDREGGRKREREQLVSQHNHILLLAL